jgi:hypothetical protein
LSHVVEQFVTLYYLAGHETRIFFAFGCRYEMEYAIARTVDPCIEL